MAKTKKKKGKDHRNVFLGMYSVFENNISLHEVSIDTVGSYAAKYDKSVIDKIIKVIEPKRKKRKKKIELTKKEMDDIFTSLRGKHPRQRELFARNTLVSIVTTIDTLFGKIFEHYYSEHPEDLSIENQKISFSELESIKKIEDARKYLIAREVELLLFQKGLKDRLKILSDKLGINFKEESLFLKEFKKLIKIRNLIVHNEGLSDSEFVQLYGDNKIKKGDKVIINTDYLNDSLSLVYFIGSYVLQEMQLKLSKNQINTDEFIINNTMHRLVKRDRHEFLKTIYNYRTKEGLDDITRKMMTINYCIALRRQNKNKKHIKEVLNKEDWSASSLEFRMAIEALIGNDKNFYKLLENCIKNKIVGKEEFEEWELFSLYHNKPKFRELRKKALD